MSDEEFIRRRNRGRLMLILVAAVFLGPLALAFGLYYSGIWSPTGSAENGILITPARPLPDVQLDAAPGGASGHLHEVWTLVIAETGDCPESCRRALFETRQLRRSLGKEATRVQRVWVITGGDADKAFITAEHPEILLLDGQDERGQLLLAAMAEHAPGEVFLVDPHGNLMMSFPPGLGMRGIYNDLKRLLKVSRIG